jgi:hypothetical protein
LRLFKASFSVVAVTLLATASSAFDLPCLGILEDRYVCLARQKWDAQFKICRERSFSPCESLKVKYEDPMWRRYEACFDKIRCDCMRATGWDSC